MYAALLTIGVLFGLAFAVTVALFYVLSLGGDFQANVRAVGVELRDRLTGRHRFRVPPTPEARAEPDPRLRSLQEELRLAHRLLEQARAERAASVEEAGRAAVTAEDLRQAVAEREARIARLCEDLESRNAREDELRRHLGECGEQLAQARREVRDLTNELDVLNAGVKVVNQ